MTTHLSIRKEDIYKLIDQMNEEETSLAYKILKSIIKDKNKNFSELLEADNTPLDQDEKEALAKMVKEDTVDWEDVKRELDL